MIARELDGLPMHPGGHRRGIADERFHDRKPLFNFASIELPCPAATIRIFIQTRYADTSASDEDGFGALRFGSIAREGVFQHVGIDEAPIAHGLRRGRNASAWDGVGSLAYICRCTGDSTYLRASLLCLTRGREFVGRVNVSTTGESEQGLGVGSPLGAAD